MVKKPKAAVYPKALVAAAKAFDLNKEGAVKYLLKILKAKHYGNMADHFKGYPCCKPGDNCLLINELLCPVAPEEYDPTAGWTDKASKPKRDKFLGDPVDLSGDFRALCCAAERAGIQKIWARYDGMGDNGSVDEITYYNRFGQTVTLNEHPALQQILGKFEFKHAVYYNNKDKIIDFETKVDELVEAILPGGWEINDGSEGDVTINCLTRRVFLDHKWREYTLIESETSFLL